MSRIDNLVKELCPDGVDYKPLATLFDTRNGYTPRKTDAEAWSGDEVPWFRMEDIRANGGILDDSIQRISKSAVKGGRLFAADSILVATSATIGEHALIRVPHLSNQRFTCLTLKDEYRSRFDVKFLYYYCFRLDEWCKKNTTVSSFQSVDMVGFKRFRFPIPPLAVQREIVRVLDQFTQLEAELEARKVQYSHYRTVLLASARKVDDEYGSAHVSWMKLGDMLDMRAGRAVSIVNIREHSGDGAGYLCYGDNGVRGYVGEANEVEDQVLIGRQGALCGNVQFAEGPFFATEHAVVARPIVSLNKRWLYHALTTANLGQYATKSAQPGLSVKRLSRVEIPVPSLEEQRRIAGILDKFDALVNDLNSGLPAEITARRKQYEYYRDRLLSFPEKGAAA